MVSATESKAHLSAIADDAADTVAWMFRRTNGTMESRRLQLLDTMPGVLGVYSGASAAVAADFYDDARAASRVLGVFVAEPVIVDRTVKIRRAIAWASEPLSIDDDAAAVQRLILTAQSEVVRPYRDTILTNQKRDPAAAGWKRITSAGACGFCKALADKGAVYRKDTAHFAAHDSCQCACAPVFGKGDVGSEASVMQYMASKRRRTPAEKERIRDWARSYETTPRPHVKASPD